MYFDAQKPAGPEENINGQFWWYDVGVDLPQGIKTDVQQTGHFFLGETICDAEAVNVPAKNPEFFFCGHKQILLYSLYTKHTMNTVQSQEKKNTMYTKIGGVVMKPKKDIIITFRTDEDTKKQIEKMAEEKEWSISQVVEKICKEYFKNGTDNKTPR